MAAFKRHIGEQIGQWTLRAALGTGGNGEVWEVDGKDGRTAALKIVHYQDVQNVRYKRFRSVVEILRRLGNFNGILPCIDACLPDAPTKKEPAWFAMPVAVPIRKALGNIAPLETAVEAIAVIANTLTSLLSSHSISHRDIKPGNLYRHQNNWAIGDFGLADYPDKDSLTRTGEKLGPANFMAPEMLEVNQADGAPADVYSLAKTLWVLASGQNFPPPGAIRLDTPVMLLSSYIAHERALFLDRLIERATAHSPQDRPSMSDFAEELRGWLSPHHPSMTDSNDLLDLAMQVEVLTEPIRTHQKQSDHLKTLFDENQEHWRELFEPIEAKISSVFPQCEQQRDFINFTTTFPCPHELKPDAQTIIAKTDCLAVRAQTQGSVIFAVGGGWELFDNGQVYFVVANVIGSPRGNSAINFGPASHRLGVEQAWKKSAVVSFGSSQQHNVTAEFVGFLDQHLREAIKTFLAKLK